MPGSSNGWDGLGNFNFVKECARPLSIPEVYPFTERERYVPLCGHSEVVPLALAATYPLHIFFRHVPRRV